jgi:hypothetical protein
MNIDFSDYTPTEKDGYLFAALYASFDTDIGSLTFKNIDTEELYTLSYDNNQSVVAISVPPGRYEFLKLTVGNRSIYIKDEWGDENDDFMIVTGMAIYFGEWNFFKEVSQYSIYYGTKRLKIKFEEHRNDLLEIAPFINRDLVFSFFRTDQ